MTGEWPLVAIGDISEVVGGSTPSTKDPENFNGDIPWLTPKDLSGFHDRYVIRGERNLSPKGLASCSARLLPPGTVLLTTRAPIGYVAIAGSEIATNQGFRSLVLRDGVCPEFVYYWLKANKTELERHASGSTFREISGSSLKQIRIPLPEESEQRAIAHILGTLDDKIELNRRMNRTLEAIARAIFKSWFVDFDPVHAKAEGREPVGMNPETAALFPDSFQDSPLGKIPIGWAVVTLGNLVELLDRKRIPLNSQERAMRQGPYPYYGAAGVMDHVEDYLFEGVHLLVGEDGTVVDNSGHPSLQYVWGKFWVNNHAHVLRGRGGIPNEYLYLALKRTYVLPFVTGAVQPKLNQRNLTSIPMLLPTSGVLSAFASTIDESFGLYREHAGQSDRLARVRDLLLPRLLEGTLLTSVEARNA